MFLLAHSRYLINIFNGPDTQATQEIVNKKMEQNANSFNNFSQLLLYYLSSHQDHILIDFTQEPVYVYYHCSSGIGLYAAEVALLINFSECCLYIRPGLLMDKALL